MSIVSGLTDWRDPDTRPAGYRGIHAAGGTPRRTVATAPPAPVSTTTTRLSTDVVERASRLRTAGPVRALAGRLRCPVCGSALNSDGTCTSARCFNRTA